MGRKRGLRKSVRELAQRADRVCAGCSCWRRSPSARAA